MNRVNRILLNRARKVCDARAVQRDKDERARETVRNVDEHPSPSRGSNVIAV